MFGNFTWTLALAWSSGMHHSQWRVIRGVGGGWLGGAGVRPVSHFLPGPVRKPNEKTWFTENTVPRGSFADVDGTWLAGAAIEST